MVHGSTFGSCTHPLIKSLPDHLQTRATEAQKQLVDEPHWVSGIQLPEIPALSMTWAEPVALVITIEGAKRETESRRDTHSLVELTLQYIWPEMNAIKGDVAHQLLTELNLALG